MRRAAARSQCANQLKQIGLGVHSYRDAFDYFPAGTVTNPALPPDRRLSFHAALLPYLERKATADKLDPAAAWDAPANAAAVGTESWHLFQCPDWTNERLKPTAERPEGFRGIEAHANYVGVAGLGADAATLPDEDPRVGMFGYDRRLKAPQVRDGVSNTLLVLETGRDVGPWLRGGPGTARGVDPSDRPLTGDGRAFGGTHFTDSTAISKKKPHGSNVLMADGSVRYVRDPIDPDVLGKLATVAGGEPVPTDW